MNKYPDVAIIIPAYTEGKVIRKNILGVMDHFENVICVNDGSRDNTLEELLKTDVQVLNHLTNIGQGGALETGIKYALKNPKTRYFITFDSDGQHRISDAEKMIEKIEKENLDIIIGSRFLGEKSNIPGLKKLILKMATLFTRATTGLKITDTHNGLRIFNRAFAEKVDLKNFGMAHASEFLDIIKKYNFRYTELPVTINYTEYSKAKGQPIINGVNILFDIFFNQKR